MKKLKIGAFIALVISICACSLLFSFHIFNDIKWPVYPKPPVFAAAENVVKYEDPVYRKSRITTFSTNADIETVINFYISELEKNGWDAQTKNISQRLLVYQFVKGSAKRPAYGLVVELSKTNEGKTFVMLTQSISGPFDWPEDKW